jgi:hypothetical protein
MAARTILVTGSRAPAAAEIARLLIAAGHRVHAGDSTPLDLAGAVNGVTSHVLPRARQSPAAYGAAVAALVLREDIDLVVPTCEEVFYLAAAREQGHAIPLFAPDFATLRLLHDKHAFAAFAGGLGLDVPQTHRLESPGEVEALAGAIRDTVFKPAYSRFGTQTLVGAERIDNVQPTPQRPWVAQERLLGEEICLYAVAERGRMRAFCAYRPLYRIGRAASYYFEPLEAPDGQALVARIVAALDYSGQIAFDAIRVRDGRLLPIECNPRATSGVHLLAGTPGFAACLAAQTAEGLVQPSPADAPAMLASAMILMALPRAWPAGLAAWRRDFVRGRDVLAADGLNRRALQVLLRYCVEALRRRAPVRAIATRDIEWDGEAIHAGS